MEHPRLFISHSSRDAELTRKVCENLAPTPERQGYDVLVDYTELKPGMEWPRQLHEYMAHCHGAVLLLTRNAVMSPWVLKEATVLTWRRALNPSFQVFPVRFPDVDDELIKQHKFGPLMLDLIQTIKETDPVAIANAVRDQVGQPDPQGATPFGGMIDHLKDLLKEVGPATLKEIAERMSEKKPAWRPDQDGLSQYVTQIARRILSEDLGEFEGVDDLIDALSLTPHPANVKQIFYIVEPCWVDAEAAGRLLQVLRASQRRAAALNGARVSEFTAGAYVRRAHPKSRAYTIIPIAGGGPGNLVAHVVQQVCAWLREKEGERGSDQEIIAELRMSRHTYYAVLPGPVDDESLKELLERFPRVAFILWTGEILERDELLTQVDWIEPELNLEKEQAAYQSCKAALKILDRMESPSLITPRNS